MPINETFSKCQKRLRGDGPDVYFYDDVPVSLRAQIVMIMQEALGGQPEFFDEYGPGRHVAGVYDEIVKILQKEMGVFVLPGHTKKGRTNQILEISDFILHCSNAEDFLDAAELICRAIEKYAALSEYRELPSAHEISVDAITEINHRFKEHAFGYEYVGGVGEIIRIDSQLLHAEAVKPALHLLQAQKFKGAEDEFLKAYEFYRKRDHKAALVEALKAFESTMKSICDLRGWAYEKGDTASKLLKICFENELVPLFWQSHFGALKSTLESGVPTARNKLGGHGQGTEITDVPESVAGYALHSTAAAIVFLVKSEQALP